MGEFTEDDVTRLAEMLMDAQWDVRTASGAARYLLEQGVTPPPPPDPAVMVAEAWVEAVGWTWNPSWGSCKRVLAAVRDLFSPEALAAAAVKVQEADPCRCVDDSCPHTSEVQEADRGE